MKIASNYSRFRDTLFPEYVALYGLQHYDISVDALRELTIYSSSDFAIRPFLRDFPEKAVTTMEDWSKDKNEHVRRLASEGLRPLLPWSFKLSSFLSYPEVSKQILTNLNNDDSLLHLSKSVGKKGVFEYLGHKRPTNICVLNFKTAHNKLNIVGENYFSNELKNNAPLSN